MDINELFESLNKRILEIDDVVKNTSDEYIKEYYRSEKYILKKVIKGGY